MTARAPAWAGLGLWAALSAAAVGLVVLQGAPSGSLGALGFAGFAGVGGLIALRQPRNAVGRLLVGVALAFALVEAGQAYVQAPGNPARRWVAWPTAWATNVWFSPAIVILPLLFPYGRLPSRRSLPALRVGVAGGVPDAIIRVDIFVGAVAVFCSAASVVVRFRRSRGAERQQLKWFALVGVLAALCLSVAALFGSVLTSHRYDAVAIAGWLSGLALLAIGLPAATGIAIFRHRLYDVDVVIRRTLVYGALTARLGATCLGLVLLIGVAVGQSNVAIALSTLTVAALFRPLRARIQGAVDRRFYRRRYDAARTLEAFSARLRDEIDLAALSTELRGVVGHTVQPAHVSLWLRGER